VILAGYSLVKVILTLNKMHFQQSGILRLACLEAMNQLATLRFLHRALEQGDLFFVSHASSRAERVEASFRVRGKKPELWRAETGTIKPISYRTEVGRTIVPLDLDANDAVFVLFRDSTSALRLDLADPTVTRLETLGGSWEVKFPPESGAPAHARFERLQSWTDRPEGEIRYFSGTARYLKEFTVQGRVKEGTRVEIDLGQVKNVAEVRVNGHSLGVQWKAPFRTDITEALKMGKNELEIQVTNLWPNRLIGDHQPGARKIAFATYDPFKADSPLLQSGLLGPVTLWSVAESDGRHAANERAKPNP